MAATACGGPVNIIPEPGNLDFGTVDFSADMPDGGYAPITLNLTNAGEGEVEIALRSFPFEYLCIPGFTNDGDLGTSAHGGLQPGHWRLRLRAGAAGASSGRGNRHPADGFTYPVPWRFTPEVTAPAA